MTLQHPEINQSVTRTLSSHIAQTVKTWHRKVLPAPVTYEEFSSWTIPQGDLTQVPFAGPSMIANGADAEPVKTAAALLNAKSITNAMVYAPMSGMYWHTNSDLPGTRLYYTFSLDKSVFKYVDPDTGEIHEDWDTVGGWTARTFDVSKERPFWHCVWSAGRRFSFGFMV